MKLAPRFLVLAAALCALVLGSHLAEADQSASILRRGFFAEITTAESAGFELHTFRISGDGSKVVYFGWDGTNHSLWVVDGDGQNNTLIEQSFQWWSLSRGLYDISEDGSTIVYYRLSSPGDPTPEITAYDVATMAKTPLLKQVHVDHWGTPEMWNIEPQEAGELFKLTADGSSVFFINRFGPLYGPTFSGFTIYGVNTDGSGAAVVFETKDIQTIPGIGADTTSIVPWAGELDVDGTGALLALAMSGSWGETDLVVMNGDGTNAMVIQDIRDGAFYGPSLSGDGTRIAFARGGTSVPETTGTFVSNTGLPQSPVQVDPASGYWSMYPHISTDGGSVVYNYDLGGGSDSSIRWADAGGAQRLPITHPAVEERSARAMVVTGGSTIFLLATTRRNGWAEIVRFDLGSTPFSDVPSVDAVTGNPDMSIGLNDGAYTFYYSTSGTNLREMYSFPFTDDPAELVFPGFHGFATWGYLYDDGVCEGDLVAGDGVFTDGGVYLSEPPPDGLELFTVRAAVASDDGVASFADFLCAFGDTYSVIFSDGFESGDLSAW